MKATIYAEKDIIGTTDLCVGDFIMGGLYGTLCPTDLYYDKVQSYVWNFWNQSPVDYKLWQSLNLNVQLENGLFLLARGGITIDDMIELKDEPKRIDLAGVDTRIIEDFICASPTRPFVDEPWEAITIEEKLEFEKQITSSVKANKSMWINLFGKTKHPLADAIVSALCKDIRGNSVLFEISSLTIEQSFVVIDLSRTYKAKRSNYAIVEFYDSYDEFKYGRMFPDKVNWEE
ncbi:hypothetical protein [Sphingobacterium faecale]|uniref:Uncharacterized protein n=1 Tax=Sphingobacterium faecale TaxID=2803775 RepID=A0ABS1R9P0_9SPHI|nr:hypothetical protein [Sphingobacterium faecale]MBL1411432.1 hypothetical protein [Sphingobacterium faecale]